MNVSMGEVVCCGCLKNSWLVIYSIYTVGSIYKEKEETNLDVMVSAVNIKMETSSIISNLLPDMW